MKLYKNPTKEQFEKEKDQDRACILCGKMTRDFALFHPGESQRLFFMGIDPKQTKRVFFYPICQEHYPLGQDVIKLVESILLNEFLLNTKAG